MRADQPLQQRVLAVDYGRRNVGLAVSTGGLAPRPLKAYKPRGLLGLRHDALAILTISKDQGECRVGMRYAPRSTQTRTCMRARMGSPVRGADAGPPPRPVPGCTGVVVGLPLRRGGRLADPGSDTRQGRHCRRFAEQLADCAERGVPAIYLISAFAGWAGVGGGRGRPLGRGKSRGDRARWRRGTSPSCVVKGFTRGDVPCGP